MTTRLIPIDGSNWRDCLLVTVGDDQLSFVADHQPVALVILAKAYVGVGGRRWTPLAVVDGDRIVGVLALADRDGTAELLHLAISRDDQERGLGRRALELALDTAAAELGCDRVELTVHPDNAVAKRLYRSAGLRPTGDERHGEPVFATPVGIG